MKEQNDMNFQMEWEAAGDGIDQFRAQRIKAAVDSAIAVESGRSRRSWKPVFMRLSCILGAACAASAVVMGLFLHRALSTRSDDLCRVNTEKGQRVSMTLSDGTRIWLNSDSELSFPSFVNAPSRDVYLSGECYFDVAKDDRKPFVVHTDVYDVTAVGTAFNVRSYGYDDKVKTTLFEGEVRVVGSGIDTNLHPDEAVVYRRSDGTHSKTLSVQSYYDALWRGNELVVEPGTTLEQLTKILERNYSYQFRFSDEKIREYTFEGVIKNSQLANVLDLISLSAPVSYRMEGDVVVFSRKQ